MPLALIRMGTKSEEQKSQQESGRRGRVALTISCVLAVPRVEWLENLETVRGWGHGDVDRGAVLWWCLVGVTAWVVAVGWETVTSRCSELEVVAILVLERVGEWVEVQGAGKRHGDNEIRRGDESVRGWVSIVTAGEVTVVG